MSYRSKDVQVALAHLTGRDKTMSEIVQRVGPFTLKARRDYFGLLIRSIVSQQISTAAARTIMSRLVAHVGTEKLTAEAISALSLEQLRGLGVSQQKASYALDLAGRVSDGRLELSKLSRRTDEEVIEQLIQVKGIGVWTAHMFMIFGLARLDVLPVGDLGIKNAIRGRYGFDNLPTPGEVARVAEPWRPFASIASWYLWRSLELKD